MAKTAANNTQHYDKLGTELFPGDFVIAPDGHRSTIIAQVIKLNPKMLTIRKIGSTYNTNTYSNETAKLDSSLVTMHLLRVAK